MVAIDLSLYKNLFFQGARAHLNTIKTNLKKPQTPELQFETFRAAHSLKSQGYAMNYLHLAQAGLALEMIFSLIKNNKLTLTPELINEIENLIIILFNSIDMIQKTDSETDISQETQNIRKFIPDTI